jgi:hypothetical protein
MSGRPQQLSCFSADVVMRFVQVMWALVVVVVGIRSPLWLLSGNVIVGRLVVGSLLIFAFAILFAGMSAFNPRGQEEYFPGLSVGIAVAAVVTTMFHIVEH